MNVQYGRYSPGLVKAARHTLTACLHPLSRLPSIPLGGVGFDRIDLCDEASVWEHEMQKDTVAVDSVNTVEYPASSRANNRL